MLPRAALVWIAMLVVAVGHGALRAALIEPRMGEQSAHVLGSLLVAGIFALLIWIATPWIVPGLDARRLLGVGIGWVLATVIFEFGFGHYVAGHGWSHLVRDYDLTAGRLWVLVLLVLLVGPTAAGALRRRRE
jgi:hypothetical protein